MLHRGAIHRVRLSPGEGHKQQGQALAVPRGAPRVPATGGDSDRYSPYDPTPPCWVSLDGPSPRRHRGNPVECWARITQIRT